MMDDGGMFCPVEECDANRGGYCGVRMGAPFGYAPAAFFMPGQTNFMAPFGPALGMLGNSTMAEGQPPMTDSWGMWRNCPRARERDLKK
jgi:hypothetical protein